MKHIQSESFTTFLSILSVAAITAILSVSLAGCEWGDKTDSNDHGDITLSPTSATLTASSVGSVTFTASGGTSNYSWNVSNPSLGRIYSADSSATYQSRTNAGVNVITVSDEKGNSASATVAQQ